MKKTPLSMLIVGFGLLLLVNYGSQVQVRHLRDSIGLTFEAPQANVPPDLIRILAGEFNGLLADYLVLEAGSFIGSNQEKSLQDYHGIYQRVKTSTDP